MDNTNDTQAVKKKKKWILPVIIGVIAVLLAVILVTIIAVSSPKRAYQKQLDLGEKFLTELDYENAILAYEEAIRINPRGPEGYLGLADAYVGIEDYDKALEVLQEGYRITGSEEIEKRIQELSEKEEPVEVQEPEEPQEEEELEEPEMITVTGIIFDTDEIIDSFPPEWQNAERQSRPAMGIRFPEPVSFTEDGNAVTISEATLGGGGSLTPEDFQKMFNQPVTVKGYFYKNTTPNGLNENGDYYYDPFEYTFELDDAAFE